MVSYPTPRIFLSFAIRPVIAFGRREINRQISFLPAVRSHRRASAAVSSPLSVLYFPSRQMTPLTLASVNFSTIRSVKRKCGMIFSSILKFRFKAVCAKYGFSDQAYRVWRYKVRRIEPRPKISAFPVRRSKLPVRSGKFLKNGMISVEFGRFW
jgi:hypothetical protein